MATEKLCECGCGGIAPLAPQTNRRFGWVNGEPMRFIRGHNNRGRAMKADRYTIEERGHDTPCWTWKLGINHNGYGKMKRNGRQCLAHRVVFADINGPIPEGVEIDHICRNRDCVNPEHLRLATRQQNAQNVPARGGSSGHRGVFFDRERNRWTARFAGTHIGYFGNEIEAAHAAHAYRVAHVPFSTD